MRREGRSPQELKNVVDQVELYALTVPRIAQRPEVAVRKPIHNPAASLDEHLRRANQPATTAERCRRDGALDPFLAVIIAVDLAAGVSFS